MYVHPTWFEGMLQCLVVFLIPCIMIGLAWIIALVKDEDLVPIAMLLTVCVLVGTVFGGGFAMYKMFEEPSVQETVVTVQEWQPRVGLGTNENGMMVVDSADDLMMVDTNGNCYYNTENFWFGKFETRDIFNQLKVNGTYRIKYYGWREGFNNGFPNILSVEQVIDENNTHTPRYNDYYGVKLVS